jgi:hypothetical protein
MTKLLLASPHLEITRVIHDRGRRAVAGTLPGMRSAARTIGENHPHHGALCAREIEETHRVRTVAGVTATARIADVARNRPATFRRKIQMGFVGARICGKPESCKGGRFWS